MSSKSPISTEGSHNNKLFSSSQMPASQSPTFIAPVLNISIKSRTSFVQCAIPELQPRPAKSRRVVLAAKAPPPHSSPRSTPSTAPSPAGRPEKSGQKKPFDWMNHWYPVAFVSDIDDFKPFSFTIWEKHYVLFRDRITGFYVAMDDVCPHRAAPLSEGRLYERERDGKKETILECGYHGWRFNCEGRCVDIPVASLEKRIPAAADVGGIYPTAVSVIDLIFVWLGDREKADEDKLPMPYYVKGVARERVLKYRDMSRTFPFSFSTMHENVVDPAHVSWSHHGTNQGDRNKVSRAGEISILEERVEDGYAKSSIHWGADGFEYQDSQRKSFVLYQMPLMVGYYGFYPGSAPTGLYVWNVPVSRNECKWFSSYIFLDPTPAVRRNFERQSRWRQHVGFNVVLDGDACLLQGQEEHLQSRKADGFGGSWKTEYSLASGTWDSLVIKLRRFFDDHGATMPFESTPRPYVERLARHSIIDRYNHHTKTCKACSGALRNFSRGMILGLVAAGVGGTAVLFSGILYIAFSAGRISFSRYALGMIGLVGLVCCVLSLLLARWCNEMKQNFIYSELAYELRTSETE